MIENLQSINVFSPSFAEIVTNVLISTACSFVISLIYRFTYRGPGYSGTFVNSLVYLSVVTSIVIMVIGNNLARAFGLVGALSIIRFRTAVKDISDIVYIFLALAIGMASGVGYHKLAFTGTLLVGLILIVFSNEKFSYFISNQYMLQFIYPAGEDRNNPFLKILSAHCKKFEVVNIRSSEMDKAYEYSYYISLKKNNETGALLNELRSMPGIRNINLYFDRQNS